MKTLVVKIGTAVGLASLLAGCAYPNGRPDHTGSGGLIGGGSGAATGALADHTAPEDGAPIGGAAGSITGELIGHSIDLHAEASSQSAPPPTSSPPPPETVLAAPGPDYVWIDGNWVLKEGDWVWISGHWVLPPYPHAVWVEGPWQLGPHGWHRVGDHWR